MRRLRTLAEKVWLLIFPGGAPEPASPGQSTAGSETLRARLAVPYTFNPNLSLGGALVAVAACLARIFSACVLFAVWGGVSALAWSAIENHFLRAAAVLLLVLLFLAGLAALMIAIAAVERLIAPRR
jgi:hypothetical protein